MKKNFSVAIVGAGSMGMAAGYYLGKRGIDTLLLDTYNPPHVNGSHHGETRLIRHIAGEGPQYAPLVLRAQELWNELELEIGKTLFHQTGTIIIGEKDAPFIKNTVNIANQFSLPIEKFSPSDIEARWPGFSIPNHLTGYFESSSGALLNEEIIKAYKTLSQSHKVTFQPNSNIISIEPVDNGVILKTNDTTYYADKVIITAGPWVGKLLYNLNLDISLQPVRKTFGWFKTNDELYTPSMFPSFCVDLKKEVYYGFPNITGSGIKIGRNDSEIDINPDVMKEDFGKYKSDTNDLKNFSNRFIPGIADKFESGKACMITKTPDKNFILDQHPHFSNIIIAGGFSGHGFKYSSVIGEILSQLIVDNQTPFDISSFNINRLL